MNVVSAKQDVEGRLKRGLLGRRARRHVAWERRRSAMH